MYTNLGSQEKLTIYKVFFMGFQIHHAWGNWAHFNTFVPLNLDGVSLSRARLSQHLLPGIRKRLLARYCHDLSHERHCSMSLAGSLMLILFFLIHATVAKCQVSDLRLTLMRT